MDIEREDKLVWERLKRSLSGQTGTDCLAFNLLASYAEGRASDEEAQSVENHLTSCPACLETLRQLRVADRESPCEIPAEILERAKGLVPPPKNSAVVTSAQDYFRVLPFLRKTAALAAGAACLVAVCLAGLRLGEKTVLQAGVVRSDLSQLFVNPEVHPTGSFDLP